MSDLYYPLGSCVLLDLFLCTAMDTRVGRSLNELKTKERLRYTCLRLLLYLVLKDHHFVLLFSYFIVVIVSWFLNTIVDNKLLVYRSRKK